MLTNICLKCFLPFLFLTDFFPFKENIKIKKNHIIIKHILNKKCTYHIQQYIHYLCERIQINLSKNIYVEKQKIREIVNKKDCSSV